MKHAPGPKTFLTPAFKVYVVEHPVALEQRSWRMVVHAVVVNHGERPLLVTELADAFKLHGRSGAVRPGDMNPEGGDESGWMTLWGTSEPRHVPPGGAGRVRITAPEASKAARDDPAALTFRETRIEFRN